MSTTATAPLTGTWTIDPIHSSVGFTVKHLVAKFRAGFEQIEGSYDADSGVLTGRVPVESIDVKQEDFRGHLLSPDFFDAAQYPTVGFVSTAIRRGGGESVELDGELTLKGVTKAVTATGTITDVTPGPAGTVIGIELETTVNRNDFGLTWNMELPGGRKAVGDDVTLTVSLELGQPAAEEA
jgi:polyisoprenoid-binding protein YceI